MLIPYGKQNISVEDTQAVLDALESDFITQGPKCQEFEEAIASYCGVKYAVAFNSATSALHCANLVFKEEVGMVNNITSPNSFVATSNATLLAGGKVQFCDIDKNDYNLSTQELQKHKNYNLITPVHFGGKSCNMEEINSIRKKQEIEENKKIFILEDASHAIGASYKDKKVGSCQYSDICIFSFHPVKIITTTEGGLATTNNKEYYEKLKLYRSHGVTREKELMKTKNPKPWQYDQVSIGLNYRMTELQAALGLSQLKRLDEFVEKRQELAKIYRRELKGVVRFQKQDNDSYSSYHLFVVQFEDEEKQLEAFNFLRKKNIGVNMHYEPIYLQPYYQGLGQDLGFKQGLCPNAEEYNNRALSIPLFYDLIKEDQVYIVNKIKQIAK